MTPERRKLVTHGVNAVYGALILGILVWGFVTPGGILDHFLLKRSAVPVAALPVPHADGGSWLLPDGYRNLDDDIWQQRRFFVETDGRAGTRAVYCLSNPRVNALLPVDEGTATCIEADQLRSYIRSLGWSPCC